MALPSGYQQVEYIESTTSGPRIDTFLIPGSDDFSVVMDIQSLAAVSAANWFYNIGTTYTGVGACYMQFGTRNSCFQFHVPDVGYYGATAATTNRVKITTTFAGTAISMSGDATYSGSHNRISTGEYRNNSLLICQNQWRSWICEVRKGGALAGRFVPAVQLSDGAVGMYDEVGKEFHGNVGTGQYTAGPVVGPTGSRTLIDAVDRIINSGKVMIVGTGYGIYSGKGMVDGVVYDIAFAETPPGPVVKPMITFYIGTYTYSAEEGMTWGEFVPSEYHNNNKFSISGSYVKYGNLGAYVAIGSTKVKVTDTLINGKTYSTVSG